MIARCSYALEAKTQTMASSAGAGHADSAWERPHDLPRDVLARAPAKRETQKRWRTTKLPSG